MLRVFISASIPNEESIRCHPVDKQSIRDALISAIETILELQHSEIVWGGHPSITALIAGILQDIWHKEEYLKRFCLYQSAEFHNDFPEENALFPEENIHITQKGTDLKESLLIMRQKMLSSNHPIHMAIFMGGREEGLSEELSILRKNHPKSLVLPLASTGGYAKQIYENSCSQKNGSDSTSLNIPDDLYDACKRYRYYTLFRRALQIAEERQNG